LIYLRRKPSPFIHSYQAPISYLKKFSPPPIQSCRRNLHPRLCFHPAASNPPSWRPPPAPVVSPAAPACLLSPSELLHRAELPEAALVELLCGAAPPSSSSTAAASSCSLSHFLP
jgi:hypothetical protein